MALYLHLLHGMMFAVTFYSNPGSCLPLQPRCILRLRCNEPKETCTTVFILRGQRQVPKSSPCLPSSVDTWELSLGGAGQLRCYDHRIRNLKSPLYYPAAGFHQETEMESEWWGSDISLTQKLFPSHALLVWKILDHSACFLDVFSDCASPALLASSLASPSSLLHFF